MDMTIVLCTIIATCGIVGVIHILARSLDVAAKQNRDFLSKSVEVVVNERHWQAMNSVEARMVDQVTAQSASHATIIQDLSEKLLAFTADGRDHVRNLKEIDAMRAQLEELRYLNSGLVARAQGGKEPEPAIRHEDGRSVARFDGEGP